MSDQFSGVQVSEVGTPKQLDVLFQNGTLPVEDVILPQTPYPNSFVVLKASKQQSAVCRVSRDGKNLVLIRDQKVSGIKPRNKEQSMLLSTLMDPQIPVQIVTGKPGSGKTIAALAAAMHQIDDGTYDKIILSKPASQVGQYDLGTLPGGIHDKFLPFLMNYSTNLEVLLGSAKDRAREEKRKSKKVQQLDYTSQMTNMMMDFMTQYNVEVVPLQLLRGASFQNAFILVDEVQVLGGHEILTIGTRVAATSKLVLLGDLNQRDERIAKKATGLYKAINDEKMKQSGLVSFIDLIKVERGPVCELFTTVFETPDE